MGLNFLVHDTAHMEIPVSAKISFLFGITMLYSIDHTRQNKDKPWKDCIPN
jgi:hypothetical protein